MSMLGERHGGEGNGCISDFWRCEEKQGNLENKGEVTGEVMCF